MSYSKRFTPEQIQLANSINLLEYAKSIGLDFEKRGNSYKVKNNGYGGLYINPSKNNWYCFKSDTGGGPIQFVMFTKNKSWVNSIKELIGVEQKDIIYEPTISYKSDNKNKEFVLPKKNTTYSHAIAYLIKTRKISSKLVNKLIKQKVIYEDIHRNCVFVGKDQDKEGNPKYANLRSTNTHIEPFKGDAKNSDKAFPFAISGNDNEVYIFESPIEVLSYLSIEELHNNSFNHHAISLSGVSDKALKNYLDMNSNINKIVICLNNDEAGREGGEKIKNKFSKKYEVIENYPSFEDYNVELKQIINAVENMNNNDNENDWELEQ